MSLAHLNAAVNPRLFGSVARGGAHAEALAFWAATRNSA